MRGRDAVGNQTPGETNHKLKDHNKHGERMGTESTPASQACGTYNEKMCPHDI